ncbi:MAG: hypothetical protein LBN10_02435 [Propionibacteriaceae bacterium]|jgi:hypothetical protein|nr:hypothetical protein [Propionibacteriaceae bacterium]
MLAAELVHALTREEINLYPPAASGQPKENASLQLSDTPTDWTDVDEILNALAEAGWPPERIRDHAAQTRDADEIWPHPLDLDTIRTIGPAQWHALLGAALSTLGLDVSPQRPTNRTTLTADERRLLQDVPPHHGNVG